MTPRHHLAVVRRFTLPPLNHSDFLANCVLLSCVLRYYLFPHHQQDDATNPLVGADSRAELLRSLGGALEGRPEYFSNDSAPGVVRPGHLIDYLSSRADEATNSVSVHDLWSVIMYGLEAIWPAGRTQINGRNMGDVWPHSALPIDPNDGSSGYVPFHKLSQWLGYSLLEPIQEAGKSPHLGHTGRRT